MAMTRQLFLGSAASFGAATCTSAAAAMPTPPKTSKKRSADFFTDEAMNFVFLIVLGQAAFGCGDVGTTLAIIDATEDGNAASAYESLTSMGRRVLQRAEAAKAAGHLVSARDYYLQASTYIYAALYFCDGMHAPEKMPGIFRESRNAADQAFALLSYRCEKIEIPYESTTMPGYYIRSGMGSGKRPLLILVNGSDGSVVDMWAQGGRSALERGYDILIFDGPGQGAMLWEGHTTFRYDYEAAVTPVVDYALGRDDVDPQKLAIQGISEGGYWVPRAIAFEHRIAAAIADPGVYDVGATFLAHLPPSMRTLLANGDKTIFDRMMSHAPVPAAGSLAFRARPYGFSSYYDLFKSAQKYTLANVASKIRTPLLVTNPQNEQFFPGQPIELYRALVEPHKRMVDFLEADGADMHCEPLAPQFRSQVVLDWLDAQLA